jgi:hypothetical protein
MAVRTSSDVAIVRYLARIDIRFPSGRDHGLFWHTDVYERRDGAWMVVWSQATRVGGRDADVPRDPARNDGE